MRRLVAALLAALLALSLVGCGGGGDTATPATGDTAVPAAAPAAAPAEGEILPDRSAEETPAFELFPKAEDLPKSVTERVADKQPMLLLFIDPAQNDTNDIRTEVDAVLKDNQGLLDLLIYDLGKYTKVLMDGSVDSEPGLSKDAAFKQTVNLANALKVSTTPYVAIVDDQGYVIFRHSGFIDSELLDRQVQRVTE